MSDENSSAIAAIGITLVAPIGQICNAQTRHMLDALVELGCGGPTVREWLRTLCPHGLKRGGVMVRWIVEDGRMLEAFVKMDRRGKPRLMAMIGIGKAIGREPAELAPASGIMALTVVSEASAPYTIREAKQWLLGLGGAVAQRLPIAALKAVLGQAAAEREPWSFERSIREALGEVTPEEN